MRISKIFKIIVRLLILLAILSVIYFGFLYLKYNQDLPSGKQGIEADALANKMLDALNYEDYKNTRYIEWTFKNKNHFKWNKSEGICDVIWKDFKVTLWLNEPSKNRAYVHSFEVHDVQAKELISNALDYFNNGSFWLVAPYKIFDPGTERRLITLDNGKNGLLVTYTSGGSTPGDSYLWLLNESGRPTAYKMWASKIPIKGLEASWDDWITTESGAQLPSKHNILFYKLDMGVVKGIN